MSNAAEYRNSFNSGLIDPLLYSRKDVKKWRSAMLTADNVILLPQGGVKRRPGTKYLATYPAGTFVRMRRFKVGQTVQHLLIFVSGENISDPGTLDVYSSAGVYLTTLNVPYSANHQQRIEFAQEADTMILFHEDIAPHRLLRSVLPNDPFTFISGSTTIGVYHPDHGLIEGDEIGISNADAARGVAAANINTRHTVTQIAGSVEPGGLAMSAGFRTVTANIVAHGFTEGERIEFHGLDALQAGTIIVGTHYVDVVITAEELNGKHIVTAVPDADHVVFAVATKAGASVTGGGGTRGTWNAIDKYNIEAANDDAASGSGTGGGSPTVWSLTSIAPNPVDDSLELTPWLRRKVALKNLPRFDFNDVDSPLPANEKQRMIFDTVEPGDRFRLHINGNRSGDKIDYVDNKDENAALFENELNKLAVKTGILVDYDPIGSSGTEDHYIVSFEGDAARLDWDPIQVTFNASTAGTFSLETITEGGSTSEDVISDFRGWPRAGAFHQRRLWMVAPKARPLTILASVTEDFFNFDVGDAQPNDAIDTTGEFDPIRHIIVGNGGFHLLTNSSAVTLKPDRDTGGYIPPLAFDPGDNVGSSFVAPVTLSGRPCYVDAIGRSIQQLRLDDQGSLVAAEISKFAQHIITNPIRIESVRNDDGDYLYVINSEPVNQTIAVLCLDIAQQVQGWTRFTTTSAGGGRGFIDLAQVADKMFLAASRLNGITIEVFDPEYFTDCGMKASGASANSWSGFGHLEGETVDVRGDEATLDQKTISGTGIVHTKVAGVEYDVTEVEAGIPFDVAVEPTPAHIGRRTRMIAATVDLFETREISVGGYTLWTRNSGSLENPVPLVSGFYKVPLRGWKQNATVTIAQRAPQPFTLRGVELQTQAAA